MEMLERPLAITDFEMTGLDVHQHEIIEIGLVLAHPKTLEVIDELDLKVKPLHIETADPKALAVNGYNEADWKDATAPEYAFAQYANLTEDAIFVAHNMAFDWGFFQEAVRAFGVWNRMDYHRIDTFSVAWTKLRGSGLESFNLASIARHLGVPEEPLPHRAINGARCAYEIYKKLLPP